MLEAGDAAVERRDQARPALRRAVRIDIDLRVAGTIWNEAEIAVGDRVRAATSRSSAKHTGKIELVGRRM